ncbi:hypothetical protein [Ruminococcus flavefaciens]|uniref:hypothetical protein n=1 Tax=Ruminococcus flavefaciens TaxID=1265 RepID=UPI0026E98B6D|nr:hypothetical protein [Ruminococcus flavefaciens]
MLDKSFLPNYILILLLLTTIVFSLLTFVAIKRYLTEHKEIETIVERSIECNAKVIDPTVLKNKYATGNLYDASELFSKFQNITNQPFEYACTEVEFNVNNETIKTMILRRASFKYLRQGDFISIYYDPYNPTQAFAKDMKGIFLHKPLRDCFIYSIASIVSLLSLLFMLLI